MEKHEIKLKCLDLATRDSGTVGFVVGQVLIKAKGFYKWVTEGDADNQDKKTRVRPKSTQRKRG